MQKITAAVITYNEENRIERCLRSLDWVDEIVVIDSYSTDRTVAICARYTQKVFHIPRREYFGGKWITAGGWYPQYKTILYRKSMGEWTGPIHMKVITRGNTGNLKSPHGEDGSDKGKR